jgi:uncharacterized membrane protein (UPF0127 family)
MPARSPLGGRALGRKPVCNLRDTAPRSAELAGKGYRFRAVNIGRLINVKNSPHYCVFNQTRESFLALDVTLADTHFTRMKGLLGRLRLKSGEGVWIAPSQGIHTFGVRFAIDLIYLDADCRVIETIESFGTFRISPLRIKCASVLELPTRTIYCSHTQVGDRLLICSAEEMEQQLSAGRRTEGAKDPCRLTSG